MVFGPFTKYRPSSWNCSDSPLGLRPVETFRVRSWLTMAETFPAIICLSLFKRLVVAQRLLRRLSRSAISVVLPGNSLSASVITRWPAGS